MKIRNPFKEKASFLGNPYLFVFYFCEITKQTNLQALTCTGLVKVGFLPGPINSIAIFLRPLIGHGSADTLVSKIRSLELDHSSFENMGLTAAPELRRFHHLPSLGHSLPQTTPLPSTIC